MSSHDTQGLRTQKPGLEDLFPTAKLGIYERFHVGNLHLTKDWDYMRAYKEQKACYDGQNKIGTVPHNVNIIAKRNQGCESNREKPISNDQFQSSPSADKCIFVSKDPHHLLKHTLSLKGDVENLESHLAAASTSKSRTCTGRERSVPAKKNKRETKDGVERIRPKWLMPFFIVLQYI